MVCGSGLRAVALGAQSIQTGNSDIVVAGGMESMTNAPYLLPQARSGFRMGNAVAVDSMVSDGLWDVYNDFHMGQTAELVAEKYGITREDQDCFALLSHQKAAAAWREGRFAAEVVPVEIPAKKKGQPPTLFDATSRSAKTPPSRRCAPSSLPSKKMAPSPPATPRASTTRPPLS
jgi:acetyl-CoA C-acetyltransferase